MRTFVFVTLLLCAPVPALAQPTTRAVDSIVAAAMERDHVPGVAVAVMQGGRPILSKGYGMADLEHRVPVTPNTVFKIGSLSKQLIAAGIILLEMDGKLRYDDPVSRYYAGTPESWGPITLRHFLTHTSGVVREGPAFNALREQPDSLIVQSAFTSPLAFPVGSKYQYCNTCYFALADIIARVSGQSWPAFLDARVFQPLGMTRTRTTSVSALVPDRARGYVWRNNGYLNAPEYLALRPSGAFLSTINDLAKWVAALDSAGPIPAQSRQAMWTRMPLTDGSTSGYGFGWTLDSLDTHPRMHHGGSLPGFRAQLARYPARGFAVIVLTNGDGARAGVLADEIARIYLRR